MRWRITVRNDSPRNELRGYLDVESMDALNVFAEAMKPFGVVMVSPAEDDYDPFKEWTS